MVNQFLSQITYREETLALWTVGQLSKLPKNPGHWAKFRPPVGIEKVNVFQLQGASPL